jgi:hypothetical protein
MNTTEFSRLPYRNVILISVGTVFGTLSVILTVMLVSAVLWPIVPNLKVIEQLRWILIYAAVGAMIASAICVVMLAPMLILWRVFFNLLRERSYSLPQAAKLTAGSLSFMTTIFVAAFAEWKGAVHFPLPIWPFVMVPVGISVFLANYLSYDRSGAVWK